MKTFTARVIENRHLGAGYFVLRLGGCDALSDAKPGQFVMIQDSAWDRDPFLPRAFSLLNTAPGGRCEILAKTVGKGTARLDMLQTGAPLNLLGPLGGCFPSPDAEHHDFLVAGGVGLPPVMMQAEVATQKAKGRSSELIYGGRSEKDIVLQQEMKRIGLRPHICTEDGSLGIQGRVTDVLKTRIDSVRAEAKDTPTPLRIMACGPNPMLWAIARIAETESIQCFVSLEEQMACGIGVCLGCAVPGPDGGFKYVCVQGPVFDTKDLAPALWRQEEQQRNGGIEL